MRDEADAKISHSTHPWRRWLLRLILAVVVLVVAAAVWVLPGAGLRWSTIMALRKAGMAEVSLAHGDLSLFSGHVTINTMAARPQAGDQLTLDDLQLNILWRPLLQRRLSFRAVALKGLSISVERHGDGWIVNGLPLPLAGAEAGDKPWAFDVESLDLSGSRLAVRGDGMDALVDLDHLIVENLRSWDAVTPVHVVLQGRIDGTPITMEGTATPFAEQPAFQLHVTLKDFQPGHFAPLQTLLASAKLEGRVGADLTIDGRIVHGQPQVAVQGQANAEAVAYSWGTTSLRAGKIGWHGKAALASPAHPHIEGRLEVGDGQWRDGDMEGGVKHAVTDADLTLLPAGAGVLPALSGHATFNGDGVTVSQPTQHLDWLAVDHLQLDSATLSPKDGLVLHDVLASHLQGLRQDGDNPHGRGWRVSLREARLDQAGLNHEGAVALGELHLDGPVVNVLRTSAGIVGLPKTAGGDGKASSGPAPAITLNKVVLSDGTVMLEDHTPPQTVRLDLAHLDMTMGRLALAAPETDSPLTLKGRIGQATLAVSGTVRPLAKVPEGNLKASLRALELPPLSPYLAQALGINLQTGQFDGELGLGLVKGKLNGKLEMTLTNLFIAPPDPRAALVKRTELPVETVLDLLRDDENRVKLSIPIAGDLSNPDFDTSDAVAKTIGGALRSTAMTTLSVVFPVMALLDAVDGSSMTLDPVPFAPGRPDLDDPQRAKLGKLADLLHQRPGLKLNLCGVATSDSDWAAILEQRRQADKSLLTRVKALVGKEDAPPPADPDALQNLAEARSRAAKAWLSGEANIDPGRLFECRGQVEAAGAKGEARVEVRL